MTLENSQNNQPECIEVPEGQSFVVDFNTEKNILTEDVWFAEKITKPVIAALIGAEHLDEGSSAAYKVQLDRALDVDTYYDIQINSGTAQQVGDQEGVDRQDIIWGGVYDLRDSQGNIVEVIYNRVPNGQWASDGNRPQVGPDDANWDFSAIQDGEIIDSNTLRVKVAAGQTMSESFDIKAWAEKITVDRNLFSTSDAEEGTETFSLSIVDSSGSDLLHLGADLDVEIKDTTDVYGVSPIAFDLNGDGKIGVTGETTAQDKSGIDHIGSTVEFDIDADGELDTIEWLSGDGDGFLVDNRDGNAASEMNGARLFGDEGGKYTDGYQKLAQLDSNNDGKLNGEELDGLELWVDDGDAQVAAGEFMSLADKGIHEISVVADYVQSDRGETLIRSTATANAETWNDVSYSLEGIDANVFEIDTQTGELTFKQEADFENPLDADGDNIYDITVVRSLDNGSVIRRDTQIKVQDDLSDHGNGENQDPDAVDDFARTNINTKVGVRVLENDSDPESDPLRIKSWTQGNHGVVKRNNNGTPDDTTDDKLVYFPNEGFTGTDTFSYTIDDGFGGMDSATVTVEVGNNGGPGNNAPDAVDDFASTNAETKVGVRVLANDSDPDGDPLRIKSWTQGNNGEVRRNNNGTPDDTTDDKLVYFPKEGFTGTDTFSYTIDDGNGGLDSATVTVEVVNNGGADNNAPDAVDDFASTDAETKVGVRVLTNDSDPDGDPLRIKSWSQGNNGEVKRNSNGTPHDTTDDKLVYFPNEGFSGTDTFSYTIDDGNGGMDTATVTIEVEPAEPAEIIANLVGTTTIDEGEQGSYKVQLDEVSDRDRSFTIQVDDGTANRIDQDASGQDIIWGGFYDIRQGIGGPVIETIYDRVPNSTDPSDGDRPATGPGDASWDYTLYQDDSINQGNTITVTVAAGETMSNPFQVAAWKEQVTVDRDGPNATGFVEGTENFSLTVIEADNTRFEQSSLQVEIQDKSHYGFVSPIAIDLNGDGVKTISIQQGVMFDILNTGEQVNTGWLSGNDGFLAVDNDGNGQIDNQNELFGGNGVGEAFAKLESFDSNDDGVVNNADANFDQIMVWQDQNENGVTDFGELQSLTAVGVATLNLDYQSNFTLDEQGNLLGERSSAVMADGQSRELVDVYFEV
ncbi:hypothetical protein Xen7305DRAFT_00005590 [Xenococcus sp. PCC 7305]|uniref:Ig-like domain-containing protein n=1 Tax=Xenococcus sp. PCC 7305 TaxID=102125 RepID=UPI0002ACA533|nr:Ig-like domain-containing protein [Xenococcus sp. PCC 7305]ELS00858.1 hypothetical protein Xen7305DRAFT_00005590 [Xenococcus sp. PCC 7305]